MSNIKQCYFVFQRQTKKWQYQEADTNLDQDQPKYLVLMVPYIWNNKADGLLYGTPSRYQAALESSLFRI